MAIIFTEHRGEEVTVREATPEEERALLAYWASIVEKPNPVIELEARVTAVETEIEGEIKTRLTTLESRDPATTTRG